MFELVMRVQIKAVMKKIFLASLVSIVLVAANVSAATVTVSSLADLQKAISKAESGDNLYFQMKSIKLIQTSILIEGDCETTYNYSCTKNWW